MHSWNVNIVSAVNAEKMRAEVWKIDVLQILLFHNNHRYFSTHRAPTKPSFTLSTHLIFFLYFREFLDIPFRGRVRFCLLFDLVQNILAFQKCANYVCSALVVKWVVCSTWNSLDEGSILLGNLVYFLFFGTLDCQPFILYLSFIWQSFNRFLSEEGSILLSFWFGAKYISISKMMLIVYASHM